MSRERAMITCANCYVKHIGNQSSDLASLLRMETMKALEEERNFLALQNKDIPKYIGAALDACVKCDKEKPYVDYIINGQEY